MTVTTLNPADKDTNAVLSNGNLTIKKTGTPYSAARSTTSKTSGKWYWEVTLDAVGGTSAWAPGIADASEVLNSIAGASGNHGVCYTHFSNSIKYEGADYGHASLAGSAADVFCFALDFTNNNFWVRKNNGLWLNTTTADPATDTLGFNNDTPNFNIVHADFNALMGSALFVHVACYDSSQATVNFGATSFAQSVPSGFAAWDTAVTIGAMVGSAAGVAGASGAMRGLAGMVGTAVGTSTATGALLARKAQEPIICVLQ